MNTQLNILPAKQLIYSALAAAVITFASCSKDNSSNNENSVTEEEAAEVVAQSVAPESGGIVLQMEKTAILGSNLNYLALCGVAKDTTFAGASAEGAAITWSYSQHWNWLLSCNGLNPFKFDISFTGNSTFNGPRLSANHSSTATVSITGLELNATQYTVNETMVRTGTQTSKIRRQITFTSEATLKAIDVKIDKATRKIVSGTAEITIKGTTSAGRSFSYTGTLTFQGNNKGSLVLNSGQAFNLEW